MKYLNSPGPICTFIFAGHILGRYYIDGSTHLFFVVRMMMFETFPYRGLCLTGKILWDRLIPLSDLDIHLCQNMEIGF